MSPPPRNPLAHVRALRLHEWAFGLFLLITALRLLAHGALGVGLEFATMAASIPVVAALASRRDGWLWEKGRLLLLPLLIGLSYFRLGVVVESFGSDLQDEILLTMDRALFVETPAVMWVPWNHPLLTEFMSLCYFLFYPAMIVAYATGVLWKNSGGVPFFNGLIPIHAIGFLGYTLVPAAGPHLAFAALLPPPADGGWITELNAWVVTGSNHVDVFPSLHTAVTVFLMAVLWREQRRWFHLLLIPATGLCLATLYLRYHYAVDVITGTALAALGLALMHLSSKRIPSPKSTIINRQSIHHPPPQARRQEPED